MSTGNKTASAKSPFEIFLITICILLGIGIFVLLLILCRLLIPAEQNLSAAGTVPSANTALATPEDFLPQGLAHMKKVPDATFVDMDDNAVSLQELIDASQNGVWFVFWASWCPDCDEQLNIISEMESLSERYGFDLILIDRMNPEKENIPAAREKLADHHVNAPCYIDRDEVCYKSWGIKEIPSSVVVDKEGRAAEFQNAVLSAGECEGMLRRVVNGRCAESLSYIEKNLMNAYGGVYTTNGPKGSTPSGTDVLSESQGLLLLSALAADDKELFDRVLGFTMEHMYKDGLFAWYTDVSYTAGNVNATLDDLRIWYALQQASEKWGENYDEHALAIMRALQQYCVNVHGGPVDYADLNSFEQAGTISLCYCDPEILAALAAENDYFASVREMSLSILQGGYISDEFPLYYNSYDYASGSYDSNDLNTAEALYTLWNLSRAGLLPKQSLDWLRTHVEQADLAARYHMDGSIVSGYEYHSIAVYGLAALIADNEGDEALRELAIRRMERLFVLDFQDPMYGSFSPGQGDTYAFDQLIALKVLNILDKEANDEF